LDVNSSILPALVDINEKVLKDPHFRRTIFGSGRNRIKEMKLIRMIEDAADGDLLAQKQLSEWLPRITTFRRDGSRVVSYDDAADFYDTEGNRTNGPELRGAYKDGTIYIREDLEDDKCVLVQELAHHIDNYLGNKSAGAEGLLTALHVCAAFPQNRQMVEALRDRHDSANIVLTLKRNRGSSEPILLDGAELGFWRKGKVALGVAAVVALVVIQPEIAPFLTEAAAWLGIAGGSAEAAEALEASLEGVSEAAAVMSEGEESLDLTAIAEDAADFLPFENPFTARGLSHVVDGEIGTDPQSLGKLTGGLHWESGFEDFVRNFRAVVQNGEVLEWNTESVGNAHELETAVEGLFEEEWGNTSNIVPSFQWPNGVTVRQFGRSLMTGAESRNATLQVGANSYRGVKSFFPESWTEENLKEIGAFIARAASANETSAGAFTRTTVQAGQSAWRGMSNGVRVEVWVNNANEINSMYPLSVQPY
jgi:hypothetical protein